MKFLPILFILLLNSCIGDDFENDTVDPELRINTTVDSIAINTSFQFESMYLNNVGVEEEVEVQWSSMSPEIISIGASDGIAKALKAGSSIISVKYNNGFILLEDNIEVSVGTVTVSDPVEKSGVITSTSSYTLTGDFVLKEDGNDLILELAENYMASTALPGLFVYLSNNQNSIANAHEISAVQVFSGAHSYTIINAGINDYSHVLYFCKPFNVKVGDGEIL